MSDPLCLSGRMKTTNRLKQRASGSGGKAGALNANHPDYFAQLADISVSTVEHCTVAEFLNRCRVRNPDDIIRFGDKARKLADSLLLAWVTTTNDSLGVLRILPVPLMKYLYTQMAAQFGWPALVAELEDSKERELRKRRNVLHQLDEAISDAPENVKSALQLVTKYLECATGEPAKATPPPLRTV
jgi:hypothetical protein